MAFSYKVKLGAFKKAGGRCECSRDNCDHILRCYKICNPQRNLTLQILSGADEYNFPGFEFHHKKSIEAGGSDGLENCEFLCIGCHNNTKSYGNNLTR